MNIFLKEVVIDVNNFQRVDVLVDNLFLKNSTSEDIDTLKIRSEILKVFGNVEKLTVNLLFVLNLNVDFNGNPKLDFLLNGLVPVNSYA